jgi:hypothetical protein
MPGCLFHEVAAREAGFYCTAPLTHLQVIAVVAVRVRLCALHESVDGGRQVLHQQHNTSCVTQATQRVHWSARCALYLDCLAGRVVVNKQEQPSLAQHSGALLDEGGDHLPCTRR